MQHDASDLPDGVFDRCGNVDLTLLALSERLLMLRLAVAGQQEAPDVRMRFADTSFAVEATALVPASKARAWVAIVHRRRVGIDLRRRRRTVEAGDAGDRWAFSVPREDAALDERSAADV